MRDGDCVAIWLAHHVFLPSQNQMSWYSIIQKHSFLVNLTSQRRGMQCRLVKLRCRVHEQVDTSTAPALIDYVKQGYVSFFSAVLFFVTRLDDNANVKIALVGRRSPSVRSEKIDSERMIHID